MKKLKELQGLFSLDHNIRLYIPSTTEVDQEAKELQAKYVTDTLGLFSELFGGATSFDAIGAWKSQKGLVTEGVRIVESYATREQVEQSIARVLEHANTIKTAMSQEAISLEYDNKLYFI